MKNVFFSAVLALALSGCAAVTQGDDGHAAHHPAGGPQPPAACSPQDMKARQDMHRQMMSAKTAEERQALRAEHMKTMQGDKPMMCGMGGGGMRMDMQDGAGSADGMQRCMEMCGMDGPMMKGGGAPNATGK